MIRNNHMTMDNLGNQLNRIVKEATYALFNQAELAQLTYDAFENAASIVRNSETQEIEVSYPIAWRPDKQPVLCKSKYLKDELLRRYLFLADEQLSMNGLVQLVTIVEAMLGDVVRAVVLKYPQKLGSKRTVSMQDIFEAQSIEEIHIGATDVLLNELSYKSPSERSESLQKILSINLLECSAFHRYMEVKASRDIFIHNRGVANEIYVRKAGSHARVRTGIQLPVDPIYFLESYESCLQLCEWLELQLHDHWHSSEREERKNKQSEEKLPIV